MAKEFFKDTNFRSATLETIHRVTKVLADYARQGFDLSLRQVFYRLVAQALWPNTMKDYKNLGSIVRKGRDAGLLDWDMIVDRGRKVHFLNTYQDPGHLMANVVGWFRIDKWEDQPNYIEVMVEKEALEGVLIPVCQELQVRLSPNKGYSSASMMYRAGKRMGRRIGWGKNVHILYLGDHDPSGLDMDNDIRNRLELYSREEFIDVHRLALTYDQVQQYDPPPNPAKLGDSRAKGYIERYGSISWELDALEPTVLANLIRDRVYELRDDDLWEEAVEKEDEMRSVLVNVRDNWEDFIE